MFNPFLKHKIHKVALQIAQQHNMESDYLAARHFGLSPIEALREFDLLDKNAMAQIDACKHAHRK